MKSRRRLWHLIEIHWRKCFATVRFMRKRRLEVMCSSESAARGHSIILVRYLVRTSGNLPASLQWLYVARLDKPVFAARVARPSQSLGSDRLHLIGRRRHSCWETNKCWLLLVSSFHRTLLQLPEQSRFEFTPRTPVPRVLLHKLSRYCRPCASPIAGQKCAALSGRIRSSTQRSCSSWALRYRYVCTVFTVSSSQPHTADPRIIVDP